ncbi:MAG: DUF2163 domain-containing protein [Pseudomonadota bacterium]
MRVFFDRDLDTVSTFWRIYRRDGVMLGFTSHDRDLSFEGVVHRAAPGMIPAAIRLTSDLSDDSAEVQGALTHATIREADLSAGLFDGAAIEIGVVDWESLEHHILYSGQLGQIEDDRRSFRAELRSAKDVLQQDLVPRTSPTCRALFCGPGCGVSASAYTMSALVTAVDLEANRVEFDTQLPGDYIDGQVRFFDGPQVGMTFGVVGANANGLTLDRQLVEGLSIGTRAQIREGCDRTLSTCNSRFSNAKNFRGEPFLPGNDLLTRYGQGNG